MEEDVVEDAVEARNPILALQIAEQDWATVAVTAAGAAAGAGPGGPGHFSDDPAPTRSSVGLPGGPGAPPGLRRGGGQ